MNLSKHLFWDTRQELIDYDIHKSYVISRVLEYGRWEDWKKIYDYYGLQEIVETAKSFRTLDKKALSFLVTISGSKKQEFRCFSTKQLVPEHCNF